MLAKSEHCGSEKPLENRAMAKCHSDRPMAARGLCDSCYKIYLRKKNPGYAERQKESVANWRRKNPNAFKIWYEKNREKRLLYVREWYRKNRGHVKTYDRKRHLMGVYGKDLAEYESIFLRQGGVCAVCRKAPKNRNLGIDHDHKTGKIRGLLCFECNWMIGYADDSESVLISAILYLRKHR